IDGLDTTNFDYVLIDCPPSLGLLTVNALAAAEEVLIPIQCEYYALEGLEQLLRTVEMVRGHLNPKLRISTILLTMYDGRTHLADDVRRPDSARDPGRRGRPLALRRRGAPDDYPPLGPRLRGTELRSVGHHVRPCVFRRCRLRGSRPRTRLPRGQRLSLLGKT